jgi:hypothetical protein
MGADARPGTGFVRSIQLVRIPEPCVNVSNNPTKPSWTNHCDHPVTSTCYLSPLLSSIVLVAPQFAFDLISSHPTPRAS